MAAFSYLLDTCRVNSATAVALNKNEDPRKKNSFEPGMSLGLQLVQPFIKLRSRYELSRAGREKIKAVLGEVEDCFDSSLLSIFPLQSLKFCHCTVCTSSEFCGSSRDSVGQVLSQCKRCGVSLCQKHSFRSHDFAT